MASSTTIKTTSDQLLERRLQTWKQGNSCGKDTQSGEKNILIRLLHQHDAASLCRYMNALSRERTFIRFQGEQFTLEEEAAYITGQLQRMEQNQTIHLVALCEGTVVGVAEVSGKDLVEKHVGVLGISVAQPYRGEGIGALLLETVLKAAAQLPHLRLIVLEVFSDNTLAIAMYRKFGFVEYGRLSQRVSCTIRPISIRSTCTERSPTARERSVSYKGSTYASLHPVC